MIKYILGRTGSGKSRWIHNDINTRLGNQKLLLVVPEQYTLQAEIELIKDLNSSGIMDVEVLSFNRLCHKVIEETGGLQDVEINNAGKAMVLRSILDAHHDELKVFNAISQKNGFIEKMSQLISEFKRVGIDSDMLKNQLNEDNQLVHRKLSDVALIMSYYDAFMSNGYFDEEDRLKKVMDNIKKSGLIKDAVIYLDGFDSFSNQEYQLIDKMLNQAQVVHLALTIDVYATTASELIFEPVIKTFNKIRKIVHEQNIEEKKVTLEKNFSKSDLDAFEREFFSYPFTPFLDEPENISLHMCNNVYDEVEYIAQDIVKNVRDHHMRYRDISIVTGGLEGYVSIIRRIFAGYNIPCFIDEKVSITNHPMVQFVLASLAAINSGFKYEDMFRMIKTSFTDVPDEHVSQLENYVLARGIRGNRWEKVFEEAEFETSRVLIMTPLLKLKSQIKTKSTVSGQVQALFHYLIDLKVPEKIAMWTKKLKEDLVLDKAQETTQIWNKIITLFEQLVELEGNDVKSTKAFMRVLEAGFSEIQLGILPPTLDQVVIGTIERSKSKPTKVMYVMGLNDGILPKKYSDEGIILDEEKKYLKNKGIDLETDSNSIMARDLFSTYVAFSKATEKLNVSFAVSDFEGKALRPSLYLERFKKVFPSLKVTSHLLLEPKPHEVYNVVSHFKLLTDALRVYVDQNKLDEDWLKILSWYSRHPDWKRKVQHLKDAIYYDNQVKHIDKNKSKQLYDLPLKASVSRLERYSKCPYSHFVHYGLHPKMREHYEIRLPDIGLLFHQTLEEFDRQMKDGHFDWKSIELPTVELMVENIVDDLVLQYGNKIFSSSSRYAYLIHKLKRVGKRAVWTLVLQVKQGEFLPYAHEVEFSIGGTENVVPPIIVVLSNGDRMMLEGRIDRVDLYDLNGKKYVKIIDYKSGSKKFSLSELYQGLQIQLIIYLEAILKNSHYFRVDALYPAGVFYFKIDDPLIESEILQGHMTEEEILKTLKMDGLLLKDTAIATAMDSDIATLKKSNIIPFELKKDDEISSRSKVAAEEEFTSLIDYVKTLIATLGQEISDGITEIKPIKNGNITGCQTCDYSSICQFDVMFDNEHRYIKNYKDEEVLDMVTGKEDANG